jgi:ethanolamine utilization cobalamin adenosyltransferase
MRYIPPSNENEMPLHKKSVLMTTVNHAFLGAAGTVGSLQIAKHFTHNPSKFTKYDLLVTASVAGYTGLLNGLRTARENAEIVSRLIK